MMIIQTTSSFVSTFDYQQRVTDVGKIFSTIGQHYLYFEIRFQRMNTNSRLLCTRRNRNFRCESLCVDDGIISIFKLNIGANYVTSVAEQQLSFNMIRNQIWVRKSSFRCSILSVVWLVSNTSSNQPFLETQSKFLFYFCCTCDFNELRD